ncbi:Membrane-bound lysozyme-inhibitor of c-type lysozyme [Methyloligella halotolerans]|uniref:Membrane-bound lysozyme-inhibitor of c-type lysozyme n=1 Tax=Methyloligella halotolerans TaxID=1177755 RepID=A0A1E2RY32_9HYPH|nr:MliC family protein [Methyloligella halotolerans]ODA67131.1 Membrane-bound lysozyme-inhibitor of c-type lysozyme [Methyloligella halotolerans]
MRKAIRTSTLSLTAAAAAAMALTGAMPSNAEAADDAKPIAEVVFKCDADKSIDAMFYEDKVDLTLSDGRSMSLPQVISGSGARYANADESFVFWNKGNTAFVTEGPDETMTFENCVEAPKAH